MGTNEVYEVWNPELNDGVGGWESTNTFRYGDGGQYGYDCITWGPSIAKNVLTVGSVNDHTGVPVSHATAYGPVDDGRIKPDIVSVGEDIYTATVQIIKGSNGEPIYTEGYITEEDDGNDGTSGAAATVTGSMALVLEHFNSRFPDRPALLASTLKAMIINSATDLGADGPDYKYGWGIMNTEKIIELIEEEYQDGQGTHIFDGTLSNEETFEKTIQTFSDQDLRITLA